MSRVGNEFKETELGWIPEEWDISNLENLTTKITDGAHHSPPSFGRGYPIATVENMEYSSINVSACRTISSEDFELLKRNSCSPEYGDVLLSKDGTIGKTLVYKQWDEIVLLSSIAIIRANKAVLLPQYLMFFLQSPYFYWNLERLRSGSAIKRIVLKDIKRVLLPIPSLKEQQKMASILSSVDEAIEKTEDIIEQTEKVKKGLMQQLLTKGIGHTKFKKTEIGEVPEEWEVKVFSDAMVLQRGFDLPTHSRKEGQYPLMSANGLTDSHSEYKVEGPGIVTGRSGTIGKVHYIEDNFWPLNTTLYVKEMYGNHPKFLYYLLSNFRLERFSTGTGVPTLNRNVVHIEKIALPPVDEQQKIALILTNVDMRMIKEKQYLQELFNFKKGLMQSLFTGKVRVKFDESEVTQV
ncbi:restriction endonuclease subunit S [Bacillus wiedmannii]|uniref:restriction endonuclease subunit S n=1 Tax=Bacillus wiedmannii TaxID=1890302 RepID=UPI003D1CFBF8